MRHRREKDSSVNCQGEGNNSSVMGGFEGIQIRQWKDFFQNFNLVGG